MQLKNLKLPKCPAPPCCSCNALMPDIRPYRADTPHKRMILVQCLAICPKCGQRQIGVRVLKPKFTSLAFISQKFDVYTQERKAELELVAHYLSKGQNQGEIALFDPAIEHPSFVVWFENTLSDPERVIRGAPCAGLANDLLELHQETSVLDKRYFDPEGNICTGLVYQSSSAQAGQAQAAALKELAADNGTIAWIECYDDPNYSGIWLNKTPSPGNSLL